MGNETKKRLLLSKWRSELETLREDVEQLEARVADLETERDDIADTLEQVKYWMHDAQFRPTWPLLRKVEDALG